MFNAAKCANKAGKHAFGLDEASTANELRKLADDIDAGKVTLYRVTTSCHAAHEEFTVRELVIEVLEEIPAAGPRVVKS